MALLGEAGEVTEIDSGYLGWWKVAAKGLGMLCLGVALILTARRLEP